MSVSLSLHGKLSKYIEDKYLSNLVKNSMSVGNKRQFTLMQKMRILHLEHKHTVVL